MGSTLVYSKQNLSKSMGSSRGHRYYLDTLLVRKISKRHFLKDIENSFQEVTQIGPEPPHFFLFQISQQIELLETSKILAKMGRSWQAD